MATKFIEAGGAATQGTELYSTALGTGAAIAFDSSQKEHGPGSIKCTTGSTGGQSYAYFQPASSHANGRAVFWLRLNSVPTGNLQIFTVGAPSANACFGVSSGGVVRLLAGNSNTQYGSDGSTLSTGVWYRIAFCWTITSATVNEFRVFLGKSTDSPSYSGAQDTTATNVALNNGLAITRYQIGWVTASRGNSLILNFEGVYVDDSNALTDPGVIRCTAKRPFANGTTNGFTGAGTPSAYGSGNARYVNEQPLSVSNNVAVVNAGSVITEEYNIEAPWQGDIDIGGASIVDYMGWVYTKALAAETGKIIVNNVQTNISITTSDAMFVNIAGSTTYPAGTGADIGEATSNTVTTVTLEECGIVFAYKGDPYPNSLEGVPFGLQGARQMQQLLSY